nr:hypothetical protein [Candidatus Njordarchaeota archaeon]
MANSGKLLDALASMDEKEISAYLVLLSKGSLTISEAGFYLDETLESVKENFGKLLEKGFATAVSQTVPMYSAIPPFYSLADRFIAIGDMQTNIGKSIGASSERLIKTINGGVENLTDAFHSREAEISEILENTIKVNEKAVRKIVIENSKFLTEQAAALRTDIAKAIEADKTRNSAILGKVQTNINDVLSQFEKNLANSTSQDTFKKIIDQLSGAMDAFKALPERLTETIQQHDKGISRLIVDFKSATDRTLGRLGKTAKTIQVMQETIATSIELIAKEVSSTISSTEKALVEAIGTETTSSEKSSLQTIFTEIHVNVIKGLLKTLDEIPQTYTMLIGKLQSELDKLSSGIKRKIMEYSESILSFSTPDSVVEKLLDSGMKSLKSETKKVGDAIARWTEIVLAQTGELLGRIGTNSITSLQSLEEDVNGFAAKSLQQFDQSEPLTSIQEFAEKVGQNDEKISYAYGRFETNLDRFRSELLEELDRWGQSHIVSTSRAAKTLENVIKELTEKNVDVRELSSDLEVLMGIGKELEQLRDVANSKIATLGSEILDSARKLTIEPSKTVLIASGRLKDELANLREKISTLVKNVTDEIRSAATKTRKELEEGKLRRDELEIALREINAKSNDSIEKQLASIDDSLKKFKEETSRTLNTQVQKLEKSIDDEFDTLREYSAESNTSVGTVIELQRAYVNDLQKKMKENLLEPLQRIREDFSMSLIKARESGSRVFSETRKEIDEAALKAVGEVDGTTDTIEKGVTELADESGRMIKIQSKQTERDINRLCTKETEEIILETSNTIDSLGEKLNELRTSLKEHAADMSARVSEEAKSIVDTVNSQLSNFNEQLKTESTELIPSIAESFSNSMIGLTSQQSIVLKEKVAEFAKNCSNRLSGTLEEITQATKQQATAMRSEADSIINDVTAGARANAEILIKVDKHMQRIASTSTDERTWPLFSKRAIKVHIEGMIERAKTAVFIYAPTSNYLPPAKELEKRKEVFFQIQLGEEAERKEETTGGRETVAGNDIEAFKTLTNTRLIAIQRAPYVVVNRDNEEILFGMECEEGKKIDATATVSEEKSYINLVKEIIAPSILLETE